MPMQIERETSNLLFRGGKRCFPASKHKLHLA